MSNLPDSTVSLHSDSSQFVEFQIDGKGYAFEIGKIREIIVPGEITPMPNVIPCVDGVSNLRGEIIPIINLRSLFGLQRQPIDDETRVIVAQVGDRTIGCTVDTVTRVMRIPKDSIKPAPPGIADDEHLAVNSFATLDDRLLILLDVDQLLDLQRLQTAQDESA